MSGNATRALELISKDALEVARRETEVLLILLRVGLYGQNRKSKCSDVAQVQSACSVLILRHILCRNSKTFLQQVSLLREHTHLKIPRPWHRQEWIICTALFSDMRDDGVDKLNLSQGYRRESSINRGRPDSK